MVSPLIANLWYILLHAKLSKYISVDAISVRPLVPHKMKNPASYPKAGYLLFNLHHAFPFRLKVKANKRMFARILAKNEGKIKNFK